MAKKAEFFFAKLAVTRFNYAFLLSNPTHME